MKKPSIAAQIRLFFVLMIVLIWAVGCTSPTTLPAENTAQPTAAPQPTQALPIQPTAAPTALPVVEERLVEFEWPEDIYLGESDTVRLSLIPAAAGYIVQADYPEHNLTTQQTLVEYQPGYALVASGQLSAAGFEISPGAEQRLSMRSGDPATFRWTITPRSPGRQRMAVSLNLVWIPLSAGNPVEQEYSIYSRSVEIQVRSLLGLNRQSALGIGVFTLLLGSGISLGGLLSGRTKKGKGLRQVISNRNLSIEPPPGMLISSEQTALFQGIFRRYRRLILKSEFLSGYSGARTFLAIPVHESGQSDAATIVKVGSRESIHREYENYERYVKDRLPPITARIQHPPVTVAGCRQAAIQYTFIGEPGRLPASLRMALLESTDAAPIQQLFATFAPNWWMQRSPYTFRISQEYDRVLPAHLTLKPCAGPSQGTLYETALPDPRIQPGDILTVGSFHLAELRPDGSSFSLQGKADPGFCPLRIRWLSSRPPANTVAQVVATRSSLLASWTESLDRFGLPDPFISLEKILHETIQGSRSVIHGDLNLENVLVGPGNLMWLIDFSETREGHTLFDAAHLAAELVVHILAPRNSQPAAYLNHLQNGTLPFLPELEKIASAWLFNPSNPAELKTAFGLACLGALKYTGISPHARHLLYLTAANYLK